MARDNNIILPRDINMNITDLRHNVLLSIRIKRNQLPHVVRSLVELTAGVNVNNSDSMESQETSSEVQITGNDPNPVIWVNEKTYLTAREIKVMDRLILGRENKEIATDLNLQECTVKNYLQRIFRKFGVNNRIEASNRYKELNILNWQKS
jgi:DNA-binding NarL/FixJ family response regulator